MALGIPGTRDRDDALTRARAALNWKEHLKLSFDPETAREFHDEDHDVDEDFCSMCGHDWCAVRINRDLELFGAGEAKEIGEIAELAEETLLGVSADDDGKAACHSDKVDKSHARDIQHKHG